MGHDTVGGGQQDVPELTRRKKIDNPLLNLVLAHIETRTDYTALIQATSELNNDLVVSVIIDNCELSNVSF